MTPAPGSLQLPFQALTGAGIRVAVVDSGVDPAHPRIRVAGGVAMSAGGDGRIEQIGEIADKAGHGTACAGIILRKAPAASIYSVRIFDESLSADGSVLVAALRWCLDEEMDVVNLSLGTTDPSFRRPLSEAAREAASAGVILVAAEHNEGLESYPAVLPDVIGVAGGKVAGRYGFHYREGKPIECVARGDEQRLCWLEPREVMTAGTSFAAPHVSGIVALIREASPKAGLEEVREILKANALDEEVRPSRDKPGRRPSAGAVRDRAGVADPVAGPAPRESTSHVEGGGCPDWIRKAALYPFNKEMHSLVRHLKHLDFEVVGIADPAGKGLAGKDAGEALGLPPVGIRICPKLGDALGGADTLILGYVDELGRIGRRDVLRESVGAALAAGLHVFSFLPVLPAKYGDLHAEARHRNLKIAYPGVDNAEVEALLRRSSRYGAVDIPVLGVFGTSSQQGKFTLQLALRRRLQKAGYAVGQVGTEHHSALFGMDFSFPMGYASPLELPLQWYAPFLDARMREIAHLRKPDIMLVGCQSGTIPYAIEHPSTHTITSLAFLLGTRPDAVVLVVNSIDPEEYVADTIACLRGLAKAPTIALAMSDKEKHIRAAYGRSWITPRQMSAGEIDSNLRRLEDRFGIPAAAILSRAGEGRLVETVVAHFSQDPEQENAGTGRDEEAG